MSFENPFVSEPVNPEDQKIEEKLDKKEVFAGNIPLPQEVIENEEESIGQMLDKKERFTGDVKVPEINTEIGSGGDNIERSNLHELNREELNNLEIGKPIIVNIEGQRDASQGSYRFGNFQGFDGMEISAKLLDGEIIKLPLGSVYRYNESNKEAA